MHISKVQAAYDGIGPRVGDWGDGSDPFRGARRHNEALQRHVTHDREWAENPQIAAFAHAYGVTVAVIDGAAPHDIVQTFRPSAHNANPVGASLYMYHDIVPLLIQGRALLLHWTNNHTHYEPVIPGAEGWRLPGAREVTGVDLGSGSEMAKVERGSVRCM